MNVHLWSPLDTVAFAIVTQDTIVAPIPSLDWGLQPAELHVLVAQGSTWLGARIDDVVVAEFSGAESIKVGYDPVTERASLGASGFSDVFVQLYPTSIPEPLGLFGTLLVSAVVLLRRSGRRVARIS